MGNKLPKVGELVLFSPSSGYGYHGVIVAESEGELKVYGFADGKTYTMTGGFFLPFREHEYRLMDQRNYWQGLTVKLPSGMVGFVLNGKFRKQALPGNDLRLRVALTDGTHQHHDLMTVTITGHLNAKP